MSMSCLVVELFDISLKLLIVQVDTLQISTGVSDISASLFDLSLDTLDVVVYLNPFFTLILNGLLQ